MLAYAELLKAKTLLGCLGKLSSFGDFGPEDSSKAMAI